MRLHHWIRTVFRAVPLTVVLLACTHVTQRPEARAIAGLPSPSTTTALKVHMHSGDLYLLTTWRVLDSGQGVAGKGVRYDALRVRQDSGQFTLPADSIVLLEANFAETRAPFGLQMLGFMTVVYGAVSVACLADPKACFGSCPTFYVEGGTGEVLQAEGFSASVARVLQARDVDPLYDAQPRQRRFAVGMRNEALETHVVESVRLHAVSRPTGGVCLRRATVNSTRPDTSRHPSPAAPPKAIASRA